MSRYLKSLGKRKKFEAIGRKIILPDNCFYFDLGSSNDLSVTITAGLRKYLPSEVPESYTSIEFDSRIREREGCCHKVTLFYQQGDKEFEEKYAFITYKNNMSYRLWLSRGHEEGEALQFFDLLDEIEKIAGNKLRTDDTEAIADICGIHALEIRGLDTKFLPRMRDYYKRAIYEKPME